MSMVRALIALLLLLILVALLVILQVWMCKKSLNLGLILPGIFLALGLLLTGIFAINAVGAMFENLLVLGGIFLVANVPTIIFGGIWLYFKSRRDTLDDLQRMQIKDLE